MAREAVAIEAGQGGRGGKTRRFAALHHRNFALLWFGLLISNSGSWMQIVAQGALVYELTNSPFLLGVVAFSRAAPMIVLPPMGGVIADRSPRMKLLKSTQGMSLLVAFVLALLVWSGAAQVWQIALLAFLSGAVNAFDQPTRQALLPDLVRREDMTSAVALNSAAWQGAALFGPALAGVTIAWLGYSAAFFANAASFLAVLVALFLMRGVPEYASARRPRGLLDDLSAGLGYVRGTRLVWMLLLLSAVTGIFGRSYVQLLPVFARDVLHQGSSGLGFMMSAPGAGTLAGAVLLSALGDVNRKGRVLFAGMFLFSGTLLCLTASRSFAATLGILFLSGVTALVFSAMLNTMLQLHTPPHMRGRVMSLVTVTMQGLTPVGALLTGALATAIGTPSAVALAAVLVAVFAGYAWLSAPVVRDFSAKDEREE